MKKISTLIIIYLYSLTSVVFAQNTIIFPYYENTNVAEFVVDSISLTNDDTKIYCTYMGEIGTWANVSTEMVLKDKCNDITYSIIKSTGLPLSPQKRSFSKNEKIPVVLIFPQITDCKSIDIIEGSNDMSFNIYGIDLSGEGQRLSAIEHRQLSDIYFSEGVSLYEQQLYKKAIEKFQECIKHDKYDTIHSCLYCDYVYDWIGSSFYKLGQEDKAKKYSEFYTITPIDRTKTSLSDSLLRLAFNYQCQDNNIDLYYSFVKDASSMLEKETGAIPPHYAILFANVGRKYKDIDSIGIAYDIYKTAHKLLCQSLDSLNANIGFCLIEMASCMHEMGQDSISIEYFEKGFENLKKNHQHLNYEIGRGLLRTGMYYFERGLLNQAKMNLFEAVATYKQIGELENDWVMSDVAHIYNTIMCISLEQKKYGDAIKYGERAVRIRKKMYGEENPLYINTASTLGLCYSIAGQFDKAYEIDSMCFDSYKHDKMGFKDYHVSNEIYWNLIIRIANDLDGLQRYTDEESLLCRAFNTAIEHDSITAAKFAYKAAQCCKQQKKYNKAIDLYHHCINYLSGSDCGDLMNLSMQKAICCYALSNREDEYLQLLKPYYDTSSSEDLVKIYDSCIEWMEELKEYDAERIFLFKKLELCERDNEFNRNKYIQTMDDIANTYANEGEYCSAINYLKDALALCEEDTTFNTCSMELNFQIASMYATINNIDSAVSYTYKAVEFGSRDDIEIIQHLFNMYVHLCTTSTAFKRFDIAEKYGLKALDIAASNYSIAKENRNMLFFDLWNIYHENNNSQEILSLLKKFFSTPDLEVDEYYFCLLFSLHQVYSELGMNEEDILTLKHCIEVAKILQRHEREFTIVPMITLAKTLYCNGHFSEAISVGAAAMDLVNSYANIYSAEYIQDLLDMADYYTLIGNAKKGRELYDNAKHIYEEIFDEETATDKQYQDLGEIYEHLGDTINAINSLKQAYNFLRVEKTSNRHIYLRVKENLARLLSMNNMHDEARNLYSELLEEERDVFSDESYQVASIQYAIAMHYARLKEHLLEERYLLKALITNREASNYNDNLEHHILESLSYLYLYMKDYEKAYKYTTEYIHAQQRNINNEFLKLQTHDRENIWDGCKNTFLTALPKLALYSEKTETIEYMYNITFLFAKGLISNTENLLSIYAKNEPKLQQIYNDYIKKNIYRENQIKVSDFFQINDIENIDREIQTLNDSIAAICATSDIVSRYSNISWMDIKEALTEEDVLVDFYCVSDSSYKTNGKLYFACIIKKSYNTPKLIKLFYENHVDFNQGDATNSLYKAVWEPIKADLVGIKRLYFSPWEALTCIPIEHLQDTNGKFLSDIYNCYRLTSARELLQNDPQNQINSVILYGGLNYNTSIERLKQINKQNGYSSKNNYTYSELSRSIGERSGFDYLPYSQEEVNSIYNLCNAENVKVKYCKLFTGEEGTEESFKSLAGEDINIIHIATHGSYIANNQSPYYDKLYKDDDDTKYSAIDNSLSRTFVVLSGGDMLCKRTDVPYYMDDGILSAKEISKMNFKNMELAVISTCNSGLGDFSSEGTMGLQQGFKRAGAKSILMTIDNVDDQATQIFMEEFYRHLLSGESKQESLRSAQMFMRNHPTKKYNSPEYWSKYILLDAID